jgi:flagellar biogenesis protein FliO
MPPVPRAASAAMLLAYLWLVPVASFPQPDVAPEAPATDGIGIPYKDQDVFSTEALTRVTLALLVAIIVAVGVLLALKRFYAPAGGGVASGNRVRLIEAKRLSPKLVVFLVQVDEEAYLLAQNGDRLTLVKHHDNGAAGNDEVVG